ncbi:MAG TPA: hypothetical protein VMB21_16595 [Candidatus Limnocylindria bacterium]|jgi:hypothetical protein|nr:hypothetical protein [Candidatus Limnocylindria bacterium]
MFTTPIPFASALAWLRRKGLLPTSAGSAEISTRDTDLRERSLFSARQMREDVLADRGFATTKNGGKQDERTGRLHFVPTRTGGALVMNELSQVSFGKRPRKDGSRSVVKGEALGGQVVFWLVPKVHQKPDATILPKPEQVSAAAAKALTAFLDLQRKRTVAGQPNPSLN